MISCRHPSRSVACRASRPSTWATASRTAPSGGTGDGRRRLCPWAKPLTPTPSVLTNEVNHFREMGLKHSVNLGQGPGHALLKVRRPYPPGGVINCFFLSDCLAFGSKASGTWGGASSKWPFSAEAAGNLGGRGVPPLAMVLLSPMQRPQQGNSVWPMPVSTEGRWGNTARTPLPPDGFLPTLSHQTLTTYKHNRQIPPTKHQLYVCYGRR